MQHHPGWMCAAFVVAVVLAAPVATAPAQGASPPKFAGRLIGVYDERSGQPIDSAEVRDMVSGSSALTTSTGTLSLFFVDTAGSVIRIRKFGYSPVTMFVQNSPGNLTPLTITLDPVAQRLPAVVTTDNAPPQYLGPFLRDFEARRKTGMGYFLPEAQLRNEEDRTLGNIIASHIPSLAVLQGPHNTAIAVSRRAGSACAVDVYLDGIFVSANSTAAGGRTAIPGARGAPPPNPTRSESNDLNQYQVSNLAAVEFHNTADTPLEYMRPGSGCGVLLLWTREK